MGLTGKLRAVRYPIDTLEFLDASGRPYLKIPIEQARPALGGKAHAFGHVPAGAEEIYHVAFAPKAALSLDQQRIEAGLRKLDGESQPGDAAAGNEDAFAVHAGCPLCRRLLLNIGRGRSNHSGAHFRG